MTSLSIRNAATGHCLFASEGINDSASWYRWVCNVPFGAISTRPDPIARAWAAVEAKRGMRGNSHGA